MSEMRITLYETAVVVSIGTMLTVAVCLHAISETVFAGLMGALIGYSFRAISQYAVEKIQNNRKA